MSWGWIVTAFLVGWLAGVWQSYRRVRRGERAREGLVGARLYELLKDADVVNITVTEDDERELTIDQKKLDELLGNTDRKH